MQPSASCARRTVSKHARRRPQQLQHVNHNIRHSLIQQSVRYRLHNPLMSVKPADVQKIDWRQGHQARKGDMKADDYKHPSYANLDWTNEDFLSDINEEHIQNTYPEYHKHWMKNFMKFTDAEFDAFSSSSPSSSPTSTSANANTGGYSKRIADISREVAQPMKYLHEWRQRIANKTMSDDYEVRLPNGLVISYDQYLKDLKQEQSDSHLWQQSEAQREPVLDQYGRAMGRGTRKSAFAQALVYAGDGTIYVNGVHYSQFFLNYSDRLDVCMPLLVTDTHRSLDVWCDVDSGGWSGKAGALRLAIARALVKYEPKFATMLNAYNLTACDFRSHERKKPGKLRARKSKKWKAR